MFLIGIGNETQHHSTTAFTLLGTKEIGYTLVPNNGGSSYYTILENGQEVQISIGNQGSNGTQEVVEPTAVYTVPLLASTVLQQITVANTTNSGITYDLTIAASGTTPTQSNSLYWDRAIPAQHMDVIPNTTTLTSGESVIVFPSTIDAITAKVYGVETKLSRFLGVGITGESYYSKDGITWNSKSLSSNVSLGGFNSHVVYGNGKFLSLVSSAASQYGYSEDGVNWTIAYADPINYTNWTGLHFFKGKFILTNGFNITYSTDGVSWTTEFVGFSVGSKLAENVEIVVAAPSSATDPFTYSTDGVSWNQCAGFAHPNIYAIKYLNNNFIASGIDSAYYSADGINWVTSDIATGNTDYQWLDIAYGNGKYVLAGNREIAYSTNGANWTRVSLGDNTIFQKAFYENGRFFVSGFQTSSGRYRLFTSTDGISFSETISDYNFFNPIDVVYGAGLFVISAEGSDRVHYSSDAASWTTVIAETGYITYFDQSVLN